MELLERALIQHVQCPYKRNLGTIRAHTEGSPCEDTGRIRPSASQTGSLERNQPSQYLELTFQASRTMGNKCVLFKSPSPWHFVPTTPASHTTLFTGRKARLALRLPPTQIFTPTFNSKAWLEDDRNSGPRALQGHKALLEDMGSQGAPGLQ